MAQPTTKVYRIEHSTLSENHSDGIGFGPYRSDGPFSLSSDMSDDHSYGSNERPEIFGDTLSGLDRDRMMDNNFYCACPTISSLKTWFDGWMEDLKEEGYVVVEYTVNDSDIVPTKSGKQVAFFADGVVDSDIVFLFKEIN